MVQTSPKTRSYVVNETLPQGDAESQTNAYLLGTVFRIDSLSDFASQLRPPKLQKSMIVHWLSKVF